MLMINDYWFGKVFFRYLTFKYFLWFIVFYYLSECISFEWVFGITLIYSKQSLSMYLLEYTRDGSINTEILSNQNLIKIELRTYEVCLTFPPCMLYDNRNFHQLYIYSKISHQVELIRFSGGDKSLLYSDSQLLNQI